MISNQGYPKRMDYFAHAGDSFKRYFLLENLDGSPFDATGCSFDFLNFTGSQLERRFSLFNLSAVVSEFGVYVPVEIAEDVLYIPASFKNQVRLTTGDDRFTVMSGKMKVEKHWDEDSLKEDVIYIDTPQLKIQITVLLSPPTDIEEPVTDGFPYEFNFSMP